MSSRFRSAASLRSPRRRVSRRHRPSHPAHPTDTLVADRNVSRAAQRMNIGEPAMSVSLGRLRSAFGDPLLVRGHGEMAPTSLALAEMARSVLEGVAKLNSSATAFDPRTAGAQLTLTAPGYIAHVLLPRLMNHLERGAPGVRVEARRKNGFAACWGRSRKRFETRIQRLAWRSGSHVRVCLSPLPTQHARRQLYREQLRHIGPGRLERNEDEHQADRYRQHRGETIGS